MGKEKAGFLTPKAISNRIKSKGLQKLKWYCQMCQKQCRDENGFKCHMMSESHQRQMLLFGENAGKYMSDFSREFLAGFLSALRCHGTKRVKANDVYMEYIREKEHVHMNGTRWMTLSGFVQWLGREGICKVDQTERGWFIAYIDRSPEAIERQARQRKNEKLQMDDDEVTQHFIDRQITKARQQLQERGYVDDASLPATELMRDDECFEKVKVELPVIPKVDPDEVKDLKPRVNPLALASKEARRSKELKPETASVKSTKTKASVLDEIMREEMQKRGRFSGPEPKKVKLESDSDGPKMRLWLKKNIVVKIISSKAGDNLAKRKAVVGKVYPDSLTAKLRLLDNGQETVKVSQDYLETVIPNIGRKVLILHGSHEDSVAKMVKLNMTRFSVDIQIVGGSADGELLEDMPYTAISKLHQE